MIPIGAHRSVASLQRDPIVATVGTANLRAGRGAEPGGSGVARSSGTRSRRVGQAPQLPATRPVPCTITLRSEPYTASASHSSVIVPIFRWLKLFRLDGLCATGRFSDSSANRGPSWRRSPIDSLAYSSCGSAAFPGTVSTRPPSPSAPPTAGRSPPMRPRARPARARASCPASRPRTPPTPRPSRAPVNG